MGTRRRENFVRLANSRVSRALKQIQLVANLSNRSNYDYTELDANEVLEALERELNACRQRFSSELKNKSRNPKFRLEG
jgi:hypothetical protein